MAQEGNLLIMKKLLNSICLLIYVFTINCYADQKSDEIEHLINYVATSGCDFERNGTSHTPTEAVEHIKKKYNYFKDKINSAEDFIKFSATQSTMTKRKYKIHCPDKDVVESELWLLSELERFRIKNNSKK